MRKHGMAYDAADSYAELIEPRYASIAAALVEAAAVTDADDILEVGAGTGLVTRIAAAVARSIVATDASREMLERARASLRRRRNVSYQLLDYSASFPFLDGSFSLVLSGLTYVQDSPASITEVARVLRRDGRIGLSMWGSAYQERRLLDSALRSCGGGRFPKAAPARAVRRLERAGFRTIRRADVEVSNRFPSVDAYIAYRRGFGIPLGWTRAFYERFLRAVHHEASCSVDADGSFALGWTVALITARAPNRAP